MLLVNTCDFICDFYAFLRVIVYSSDTLQQMPIMSKKRKPKTFKETSS